MRPFGCPISVCFETVEDVLSTNPHEPVIHKDKLFDSRGILLVRDETRTKQLLQEVLGICGSRAKIAGHMGLEKVIRYEKLV